MEILTHKLKRISDPEIRTDAMTLAQQYRQEGREEGREEGRLEGRQEGRRTNILEALQIRFGNVPGPLRESVGLVSDEAILSGIHRAAIRCESLDDFTASFLSSN